MKIYSLILLGLLSSPLRAAQLAGVEMPDSLEVAGQARTLNGLGLRLATMFKVKVYVAGLYVANKTQDADVLLKDTQSKLMRMSFLRDLKAEQLQDALQEGFEKACTGDECAQFKEAIAQFAKLQPAVKKGETLDYVFQADKLDVVHNGKTLGTVNAGGFSQVMLRVWLGKNPPNSELRTGLLGL